MIFKPIYEPKGRANEYGSLAINIYDGCNHGCYYCYAPNVVKQNRETFAKVGHRLMLVESVKRQLEREKITGQLIHLCFTCDPYPAEVDTTPTREVIKAIKAAGNNVQILTKGGERAERDFDLLGSGDWFGVTYTGLINGVGCKNKEEPNAAPDDERLMSLIRAKWSGISTWLSCEPVLDTDGIYTTLQYGMSFIDLFRIGKLNYHASVIDWATFGAKCIELCQKHGRNYYIKEDLLRLVIEREAGGDIVLRELIGREYWYVTDMHETACAIPVTVTAITLRSFNACVNFTRVILLAGTLTQKSASNYKAIMKTLP